MRKVTRESWNVCLLRVELGPVLRWRYVAPRLAAEQTLNTFWTLHRFLGRVRTPEALPTGVLRRCNRVLAVIGDMLKNDSDMSFAEFQQEVRCLAQECDTTERDL